jgi:hypothetical protein
MPFGKSGKFDLNPQRANAMPKTESKPKPEKGMGKSPESPNEPDGDVHSDVRNHLEDMAMRHGGIHMHIHGDGVEHTTHHVGEDGEVQGPHIHPDIEALKQHVHHVMGGGESPMHGMLGQGGDEGMSGLG